MVHQPNVMATPPAPNGEALRLISALSNTRNHDLHMQAIKARDEALSASSDSYANLCLQLMYVLVGSDHPENIISRIDPHELEIWKQQDPDMVQRLQNQPDAWIAFGQLAGLILKNALLRPPILPSGQSLALKPPSVDLMKESLLFALGCRHAELRAVASSVVATTSVSVDTVQPHLYIANWKTLIPVLIQNLKSDNTYLVEGSLATVRKMLEDGPGEFSSEDLDYLVPVLLRFFSSNNEKHKVSALQSIVSILGDASMPSALVIHFQEYLGGLSHLANDAAPIVRQWVCRSIVTLLEYRTEYLQDQLVAVCQFLLHSTSDRTNDTVALEACEFWLTFANLDQEVCTPPMIETVRNLLPQLIPLLLQNMVYLPEQQAEIQANNELDAQDQYSQASRPVFHRSRAAPKHLAGFGQHDSEDEDDDGYEEDDEGEDEYDPDDGNEWTLRKCAAASLDSLSNMFGSQHILPSLLPNLEKGLSSSDPWVQEASILALGACAEGCREEMNLHMPQLYPYLMNHLATPESPHTLPQVKSIAAWTIGRYSSWAVEQVQTGAQGHLLAQMTEIFLARLTDKNRRVQVACGSAFGVLIETAGDLMTPYLEHVFQGLVAAMSRYQGRSLLIIFDVIGIIADYCGPAIAEGNLPSIYVPPLLMMWNSIAKHNPSDKSLLPLMEALASIAMTSGTNFQPYALECFDNAMSTIETVQLELQGIDIKIESEEEADPIVCATDLLDGLVEGLTGQFQALVASSQRYGQHFLSVFQTLCQHDIPGVRMSALALLGDIARSSPSMLESCLSDFVKEAISNMDPVQPMVCTNAVWALGEIFVQCEHHPSVIEPFASSVIQNIIPILVGNGPMSLGRGVDIPGLPENASACVGRLAKVNPLFVSSDLSRFLLGWCDGMAKIIDPTERRDAFEGFIKAVYANPQAIHEASANVQDSIASILFAIMTWHIPPEMTEDPSSLLHGEYKFRPFPHTEKDLQSALAQLIKDMHTSLSDDTWRLVLQELPVNVRRLLRENYKV